MRDESGRGDTETRRHGDAMIFSPRPPVSPSAFILHLHPSGYNAAAGTSHMPILTLHRPNFCAECGAKILRLRWRLWTNRKFCDSCALSLRKQRWTTAGVGAFVLFIAGFIFGYRLQPSPPPLIIQRRDPTWTNSSSPATP